MSALVQVIIIGTPAEFYIVRCKSFDYDLRQMVYPIRQGIPSVGGSPRLSALLPFCRCGSAESTSRLLTLSVATLPNQITLCLYHQLLPASPSLPVRPVPARTSPPAMDVFWQLYIVNHLVTFRGRKFYKPCIALRILQ